MATTYDVTSSVAGAGKPWDAKERFFTMEQELDFSLVATSAIQNDVFQLIRVPAGTFVQAVLVKTLTLSTELDDLDVGDGSDVDGYHDGLDPTSAVNAVTGFIPTLVEAAPNTVLGYTQGKFYTAEDTIDLKVITNDTILTGKVSVVVLCFDLTPYPRGAKA